MAIGMTSSATQVTISGGVALNNSDALVQMVHDTTTGGNVTMGTVPAGKKWRIIAFNLSSIGADAGTSTNKLQINGADFALCSYRSATGTTVVNNVSLNFVSDYPVVTAGNTILLVYANGIAEATVWYVEESA